MLCCQYESIDAGMFKMEPSLIDPNKLLQLRSLSMLTKRCNVDLKCCIAHTSEGIFVLGDIYRLEQVVRNLVTNASKFTPAGGVITVTTGVSFFSERQKHDHTKGLSAIEEATKNFTALGVERCGELTIKVTDNGVGIKAIDQAKLFSQFAQFNKNELQGGGGSGLGLWISHNIVERHGGSLKFESAGEGSGSSFFFGLTLYSKRKKSDCPHSPFGKGTVFPINSFDLEAQVEEVGSFGTLESSFLHQTQTLYGRDQTIGLFSTFERSFENSSTSYASNTNQKPSVKLEADLAVDKPSSIVLGQKIEANLLESVQMESSLAEVGKTRRLISFLLVDDLAMNRKMLRRTIESEPLLEGSVITEAEDGVEAVRMVVESRIPFDCIFMDSIMKVMHGSEAVRAIRALGTFSGVIVGFTGNAMQDDVDSFIESGLDRLIIKPMKRSVLLQTLTELCVLQGKV